MKRVPLGELVEPKPIIRARTEVENLPVLSMTIDRGLVEQGQQFKKRIASVDTSDYLIVDPGDLVMGLHLDEGAIGFAGHVRGMVSPAYRAWRLRDEQAADRRYLGRYLRSQDALDYYDANMSGTAHRRRRLAPGRFDAMPIPCPSMAEQRRIADILDKADELRAMRRATLQYLDELTQSIFLDMFGSSGDEPVNFAAVCHRVTVGVVVKPASHYVSQGVPALRTTNVRAGRLMLDDLVYFSPAANDGPLRKSKLRAGDLVIARTGQPGTTATIPAALDGANAIDLIIATPDTELVHPTYLEAFLNSAAGRRLVSGERRGQIQQHFNVGSLKAASIPIPPMGRQLDFVDRVQILRRTREAADVGTLDDLFASLQALAFQGEL